MLVRRMIATALLAALLPLLSCGGGSATAPDLNGPVTIRFEDRNGPLQPHESEILSLLNTTLAAVADSLPITGVAVTVSSRASGTIPGYGFGGFTPDAQHLNLFLDPSFPHFATLLPERLPGLFAHELHHAMRWRSPGYGSTLLEAMVSEGLADHFAIELLGVPAPPWTRAFPADSTGDYLALARPEFDSMAYDHERWFFGQDPSLPRWTGYTLGFRLVETYQAGHPGTSATALVSTSAEAFRPQ